MRENKKRKREQAFDLYKEHSARIDLIEIARLLDCPPGTIRGWKSKDKWDEKINGTFQEDKAERSISEGECYRKAGAPQGNQNGVGNKGGAAPKGNKNAVKTGEHETIFFKYLSDEEKEIYSLMDDDPLFVLSEEVRLLKIRQRRMMQRIKDFEAGLSEEEIDRLQELRNHIAPIKRDGQTVEVKEKRLTEVQVTRKQFRKIDTILSIEEALTRVSNQLIRTIKQLADLGMNEHRAGLFDKQAEKAEVEIRRLKIQNGEVEPEEIGDDGFVDAIKGIIQDSEVWSDGDIET